MIGHGIDLVHVPGFGEQLAQPGTTFDAVFTSAERRYCTRRATETGQTETHLAARWAAKEAFIKAWSSALLGSPPVTEVTWTDIEIVCDLYGRPSLLIHEPLRHVVDASVASITGGASVSWLVSLSHDGDYAMASVVGVMNPQPTGAVTGNVPGSPQSE